MDLTDHALILRFQETHDQAAFDLLMVRYYGLVYSICLHYVKQAQDAEDLAQDTFLRVLSKINRFDTRRQFKPWVATIARNLSLDWLKKKKPYLILDAFPDEQTFVETLPDMRPLPDEILRAEEIQQIIQTATQRLTPNEQTLVHNHAIKGKTLGQIAQETGEPVNSVKSRYRRALIKLRSLLFDNQS